MKFHVIQQPTQSGELKAPFAWSNRGRAERLAGSDGPRGWLDQSLSRSRICPPSGGQNSGHLRSQPVALRPLVGTTPSRWRHRGKRTYRIHVAGLHAIPVGPGPSPCRGHHQCQESPLPIAPSATSFRGSLPDRSRLSPILFTPETHGPRPAAFGDQPVASQDAQTCHRAPVG